MVYNLVKKYSLRFDRFSIWEIKIFLGEVRASTMRYEYEVRGTQKMGSTSTRTTELKTQVRGTSTSVLGGDGTSTSVFGRAVRVRLRPIFLSPFTGVE